jgi:hypothetical protein
MELLPVISLEKIDFFIPPYELKRRNVFLSDDMSFVFATMKLTKRDNIFTAKNVEVTKSLMKYVTYKDWIDALKKVRGSVYIKDEFGFWRHEAPKAAKYTNVRKFGDFWWK